MTKIFNVRSSRLALVVGLSCSLLALPSCSEDALDEVNRDKNHAQTVQAQFTLSEAITATAFSSVSGELNTYFSIYSELVSGVAGQMYNAEVRNSEPQLSSTYNNDWGSIYKTLMDSRSAAARAASEQNFTTQGIAQVLEVINGAILTDAFGDVPFSEASAATLVGGKPAVMRPKMDKQEAIYAALHAKLDEAILNLAKGDRTPPGAQDLLYAGNADKWTKLAFALKARLTMQTLLRASNRPAALAQVLDFISKSFSSQAEEAAFNVYDGNNLNPIFARQTAREFLAASKSYIDKLTERNDPRLRRILVAPRYSDDAGKQLTGVSDAGFNPVPNGAPSNSSAQGEYSELVSLYAQTGNSFIFSYHELLFLKAEAHARLGQSAEAEAALQQAIAAAFATVEQNVSAAKTSTREKFTETTQALTAQDAATYFTTSVAPRFASSPIAEVMVQKYIAMLNAGGEGQIAFNDIRRLKALGENFITLANPQNSTKFPHRAGYGTGDTSANSVVSEAFGNGSYVYAEPVWWAGGSR